MTAYSVIKNMLWDSYGYTLPDDPSYLTTKIFEELDHNGYKIVEKFLNDSPSKLEGRESGEVEFGFKA